jgi:hypothetical protein
MLQLDRWCAKLGGPAYPITIAAVIMGRPVTLEETARVMNLMLHAPF